MNGYNGMLNAKWPDVGIKSWPNCFNIKVSKLSKIAKYGHIKIKSRPNDPKVAQIVATAVFW